MLLLVFREEEVIFLVVFGSCCRLLLMVVGAVGRMKCTCIIVTSPIYFENLDLIPKSVHFFFDFWQRTAMS